MDFSIEFDLKDLEDLSSSLFNIINSKVILFYGEMGIGKTTLIKSLVQILGGIDEVTSPTFSLVNEYRVTDDLVYHFDFYRIEDAIEALDLGFEDYLKSGHWVFIEWPDKIDDLLPSEAVKITIKQGKKCSRALDLELVNDNN
ncbi:MAG: tRNA (adenosine(37)-N6)-threonylcarbamoyltransferase complex ATPase subunit type 1 TsaE [Flavobacteriaceae bacterium]|nr:tRNA (adenosine(37)-N6)-threonylcarbamoyltransferase complex ATPase subunit type 1 TsaE [Bacteroidia bacterium]NNF74581.1 tRNA (adenosine(37)-N6)-threonylcarbamoyltransferase complex ATPase subunit type 1 TsaE [Flavobacteriaceae bacterium]NNK88568.1 tRNA (adenosine(37)-N6)-threonylcarbamoyltransferase complex ATPase subunit type 1 TsaE [Flavobacteriaceae bacterium]